MEGLSLLGGIAKGIAAGRAMKIQREDKKEMTDIQKQLAQIQIQNAKIKQKELDLKNSLLQPFLAQLQAQQTEQATSKGTSEEPNFGASFEFGPNPYEPTKPGQSSGGGVTDMMAHQRFFAAYLTHF